MVLMERKNVKQFIDRLGNHIFVSGSIKLNSLATILWSDVTAINFFKFIHDVYNGYDY